MVLPNSPVSSTDSKWLFMTKRQYGGKSDNRRNSKSMKKISLKGPSPNPIYPLRLGAI